MSAELGKIWVFDDSKLEEALARYQQASIEAYPEQQEKIKITMLAIRDFLNSDYAEKLTMNVKLSDKHKDEH